MNARNKSVRHYLRNISTLEEYNRITRSVKLTDEEYKILDLVFVRGYNYGFIGDMLGYSESAIKRKVKNILQKFKAD